MTITLRNLKVICESHPFNSLQFSSLSKQGQCAFVAFSALLYTKCIALECWTQHDVGQIISYGDELLSNQLQKRMFPDTSGLLVKYLLIVANSVDGDTYVHS